jgi:arginine/lysine/ornithine decarboxylase
MIKLINSKKNSAGLRFLHDFPLLNKLSETIARKTAGFHTPGHQQGRGISPELCRLIYREGLKMDLTELPGLDNLKKPLGCLEESQGLAARLFGACKTFFLVNGSTVGLQAALLAANKPGGRVALTRQSHVSLSHGFVLTGGKPVPVAVDIDETWGIPLGVGLERLKNFLAAEEKYDALVITQPNYQGVAQNAFLLSELCREHGVPLIVDEAHGAHLYFQEELPVSAQKAGADMVVQSSHKTLTAFTQASMLHVNTNKWIYSVEGALDILHTSSPSYLLLASLDSLQGQMRRAGRDIIAQTLDLAWEFRKRIPEITGYQVFDAGKIKGRFQDPAKLAVSPAALGITGWELADMLQREYGIYAEYSDYYYLLLVVTPGHDKNDLKILLRALKDLAGREKRNRIVSCGEYIAIYKEETPLVITPRQAYYSGKKAVAAGKAAGRIAGKPLTIYPPGIPLIWPGQVITKEHLECLKWAEEHGLPVQGLSADGMIEVVKETKQEECAVK